MPSTNFLESQSVGLALDFVRTHIGSDPMVEQDAMSLLTKSNKASARHNDLNNEVVDLLNRAVADANGTIYAFGSAYDDGDSQGVHDIHMNQGNPQGNHSEDDGVWQDGAIFMSLPATNTWIAVFIAFQTQSCTPMTRPATQSWVLYRLWLSGCGTCLRRRMPTDKLELDFVSAILLAISFLLLNSQCDAFVERVSLRFCRFSNQRYCVRPNLARSSGRRKSIPIQRRGPRKV